ncbi:MAG TPA: PLP-dependent aminotransferase family protein [Gemmatimonadales bacterium]|nr:PLP-dependent aminotransferase family protein [Gemmatimonadales bacterium]
MTMWSPNISPEVEPLYQALLSALQSDIDAGVLIPGARLPTQRELASRLGVAIGTVSRAYALAEQLGIVSGEVGRGTFVRRKLELETDAVDEGDDPELIDLSKGRLVRDRRDPAPARTLQALSQRSDLDRLLDFYQPAAGMARHRAAGAAWLRNAGMFVEPERVVITSGAQHGAATVLGAIARPGDLILTEEVTYSGIKALASLLHLELRGLPMDEQGLTSAGFESACRSGSPRALFCMATLQNPTGRTMPLARRREIAAIAEAHDVAILEDDVNGFLPSQPITPIAALAPAHTYYITGTSKSLAPGLRIGYVVPPAHRVDRVAATIRATTWLTAPLLAELTTAWIESGQATAMAEWKRNEIAARYAFAQEILGPWLEPSLEPCFHLWISLPEPWRTETFVARARDRGVVVNSSEEFMVGRQSAPHSVRVCLGATLSRERLEDGLRRLAELLNEVPEPSLTVY